MKLLLKNIFAGSKPTPDVKSGFVKSIRILLVAAALAAIVGFMPDIASRAQRPKEGPANVASVSSRTTANGAVITIVADTSLNRVQTWQDSEGYHVTLPYSGQGEVKGSRGVKVRQVGRSLEVVVQVKPGANVTVQPQANHLTLQVDGKLDTSQSGENEEGGNSAAAGVYRANTQNAAETNSAVSQSSIATSPVAANNTPSLGDNSAANPSNGSQSAGVASSQPASGSGSGEPIVPAQDEATDADPANIVVSTNNPDVLVQDPAAEEGSLWSMLFSGPGVLGVVGLGLVGLFVIRRRKASSMDDSDLVESSSPVETALPQDGNEKAADHRIDSWRTSEQSLGLVKANSQAEVAVQNSPSHAATSLFGAYRVDQEIGKLVLGQPHRMDVLASRAPDDRRAMEVALIKALMSPHTEDDGRRRARQALEEYGFVARQSATLLMGQDVCERAAAARSLGEIGAPSSLPFLLEALYDNEPIVRNQCVTSLGTLKLPSAIGALLDVARRHPSIPDSLLSHALSACSVESFDFFDAQPAQPVLLSGRDPVFTGEITGLESTGVVDDLPDFVEDAALIDALAQLESSETPIRAAAVRQLAQFPVQRSVEALASVAIQDPEAAVRASAVSSLGSIDHESVFAPVLIAMADESREVRAAAARSLTGLNFDRADAYVRVIETASDDMMQQVAKACIKAGMVSQAIDRLASSDRRQAYEAFSLASLLAKANEAQPILEAIEHHQDNGVRMCAVRVLGLSAQPQILGHLRQLAGRDYIPEAVRPAILEVIYKIDQAQPAGKSTK